MQTQTAISTISYNSDLFLKNKLDDLIQKRIIGFYFYIHHQAEEQEEKAHVHLFILPAKKLDTLDLQDMFHEVDNLHEKPLGVIMFQKSKFDDAYLYFLHDKAYLDSKGMERKFHYNVDDILTSDRLYLNETASRIDWSKIKRHTPSAVIRNAVLNGVSWWDLIDSGVVPAQQYSGWQKMYNCIWQKYHACNSETGEIEGSDNKILHC
jgi:hypothetical protein